MECPATSITFVMELSDERVAFLCVDDRTKIMIWDHSTGQCEDTTTDAMTGEFILLSGDRLVTGNTLWFEQRVDLILVVLFV